MLICLRSYVEESWPNGPTFLEREAETACAMKKLGVPWLQLENPDSKPDWDELRAFLLTLEDVERVFAPLPEVGGHDHHNAVGSMARELFGGLTTFYTTYTHSRGRSIGNSPVPFEESWIELKREALECYQSQIALPQTSMHFQRPLAEYYLE